MVTRPSYITPSTLEKYYQRLDYLMSTTTFQKIRFQCYQEAGVIVSYFILICYSSFFPVFLLVNGFSIVKNLLHPCRGYVEATGIYDGI
jgi:hypothetical protein